LKKNLESALSTVNESVVFGRLQAYSLAGYLNNSQVQRKASRLAFVQGL
jgi:hypothetical protein